MLLNLLGNIKVVKKISTTRRNNIKNHKLLKNPSKNGNLLL